MSGCAAAFLPDLSNFRYGLSLRYLWLLTSLLGLLAGCAPSPTAEAPSKKIETLDDAPDLDLRALEAALHRRINAVRTRHGVRTLRRSHNLDRLARLHSADMARQGFFGHENPRGEQINDRARRLGMDCEVDLGDGRLLRGFGENLFSLHRYTSYRDVYAQRAGESVQVGRQYAWRRPEGIVRTVVDGWMNSPGHRKNILHPHYRAEGLRVVPGPGGELFVTQALC